MSDTPKPLTQKQEAFCIAYLETGNSSESYRRAYDAENMKPETINKRASELLLSGEIAGRLQELRKPAIEKAQITLEQHLNDLKRLRDAAESAEKYGPAIQAEVSRGKASGLYVDKVDSTVKVTGNIDVNLTADEAYKLLIEGNT
jgi:phage terminase small subunit